MTGMKLNQKGYMLVEIIIASVLAMSIAYYLLNLTYRFKDTNEDLYHSITYLTDKNVITKNIMNDLERGSISNVTTTSDSNHYQADFYLSTELDEDGDGVNDKEKRRLEINRNDNTIIYGLHDGSTYQTEDVSYYKKTLEPSLMIGTIEATRTSSDTLGIIIPVESIYDDTAYNIILFAR